MTCSPHLHRRWGCWCHRSLSAARGRTANDDQGPHMGKDADRDGPGASAGAGPHGDRGSPWSSGPRGRSAPGRRPTRSLCAAAPLVGRVDVGAGGLRPHGLRIRPSTTSPATRAATSGRSYGSAAIVCSVQGTTVSTTYAGSSSNWDYVTSPFVGWVPDVFLDTRCVGGHPERRPWPRAAEGQSPRRARRPGPGNGRCGGTAGVLAPGNEPGGCPRRHRPWSLIRACSCDTCTDHEAWRDAQTPVPVDQARGCDPVRRKQATQPV